jgi:hypothetical protein
MLWIDVLRLYQIPLTKFVQLAVTQTPQLLLHGKLSPKILDRLNKIQVALD